jgi:hypothetical protein
MVKFRKKEVRIINIIIRKDNFPKAEKRSEKERKKLKQLTWVRFTNICFRV